LDAYYALKPKLEFLIVSSPYIGGSAYVDCICPFLAFRVLLKVYGVFRDWGVVIILQDLNLCCFSFFLFFGSTEAWTEGLHLESLHQPYFCEGFFKIESHKLFALGDFEPRSS
jgi:hypothetical protein